jgi:NAD(P)-dependent dehydrogenase (short-subunit alcohol dehydrogenase family)
MKAIVLGGSGFAGTQIVSLLTERGVDVLASCARAQPNNDFARWMTWNAADALHVPKEFLSEVSELTVFYCIGVSSSKLPVSLTPIDEFTMLIDLNCLGFVRAYQAIRLFSLERLNIVVLSSDATTTTRALNGAYTISKTSLELIARTIACEDGEKGVRINTICPSLFASRMADEISQRLGYVNSNERTAMAGLGTTLGAEDVAQCAIDVAYSTAWAHANGQVFRIGAPPR